MSLVDTVTLMRDQEPGSGHPERRLTTKEAAELLGVKPETVYAYVSRGQLGSRRVPGGRGSTFDAQEVETLARRNRRESNGTPGTGAEQSVRTRLTLIDQDRYYYRGVDATELAARHSYEEVAEWLWTGRMRTGATFTAPRPPSRRPAARSARCPNTPDPPTGCASPRSPPRWPTRSASTSPRTRSWVRPAPSSRPSWPHCRMKLPAHRDGGSLAQRLWGRLSWQPAAEAPLHVLDTALALHVDHDLAASTLAVRVAASARAHAYAAVTAGLGVIEGPLHGAASGLAHRLVLEVLDQGSAGPVIAEELRAGRRIPGLGHRLYAQEDPRARALFALLEEIPEAAPALAAARDIVATAARHTPLHANVDLALAVLTASCGMEASAGETVFAVARTAGWIAHALEEYGERPLRMRPSGLYVGPKPPRPLPE